MRNTWGAYFFSKVHIRDSKIAYLDDLADLVILPYGLHFSEDMTRCHYRSSSIMQNPCKMNLIED